MINFTEPTITGSEVDYIKESIDSKKLSGDGKFTKKCQSYFNETFSVEHSLLTTSCTHSLELAALALNISPGDEVICPSFTFTTSASAFSLRGAKLKFIDIDPEYYNLDLDQVEKHITSKTKVIVPVHYAGISCDMDRLKSIAEKNNAVIVEDAAQAIHSDFKGKPLGTIGSLGAISFHETKNINCGEGGALFINDPELHLDCEIIREKGTNRSQFLRGEIDKYSWKRDGSSYLLNELSSAFLFSQLSESKNIIEKRKDLWNRYKSNLTDLDDRVKIQSIPEYCHNHNAHMFSICTNRLEERAKLISFLKESSIQAASHYVPLHSTRHGQEVGEFVGDDKYTTKISETILRLPLHYNLKNDDIDRVCEVIQNFYRNN